MTKYWTTLATTKEGLPVAIFTETTDDAIELDRRAQTSLMEISQQIHFAVLPETLPFETEGAMDHFHLAEGAIMAHCRNRRIILGNALEEVTYFQPTKPATNRVGEGFLVPIWEEVVAP